MGIDVKLLVILAFVFAVGMFAIRFKIGKKKKKLQDKQEIVILAVKSLLWGVCAFGALTSNKIIWIGALVALLSYWGSYSLIGALNETLALLRAAGYEAIEMESWERWTVIGSSFVLSGIAYACSALHWLLGLIVAGIVLLTLGVIQFFIPAGISDIINRGIQSWSFQFSLPVVLSVLSSDGQTPAGAMSGEGLPSAVKWILIAFAFGFNPLCRVVSGLVNSWKESDDESEEPEGEEPEGEGPEGEEPEGGEPEGETEPEGDPGSEDEDDESEFEEGEPRRRVNWWTVAFVATLVAAAAVVYFVILK